MEKFGIELRPAQDEDLNFRPKFFEKDGEDVEVVLQAHYFMLFPEGSTKPLYYFRNMNQQTYRWGGVSILSDDPFGLQTSAHHKDLPQSPDDIKPLRKVNDSPLTYEVSTDNPHTRISITKDTTEIEEGDVLSIKSKAFPYVMVSHNYGAMRFSYYQRSIWLEGTYEGKPVKGMGVYDRTHYDLASKEKFVYDYFTALYSGIREDGRKETFVCYLDPVKVGKGGAYYYIDGEEPIITDEIWLDTTWKKLPYMSDGTCTYKDAVWRFANKEIHFTGLWGAKGFTDPPRLEKSGQSHILGTWYEGNTPYKHQIYHGFNENSGAFDYSLKEAGFKVED